LLSLAAVRAAVLTQTDQELLEAVEQGVLEHQQALAAAAHRLNLLCL
jgi:hypothetical protein